MRIHTGFLAAMMTAALPTMAAAQDMITFADPDVLLEIAKGYGSAELGKDSGGDPLITGRLQGMRYSVFFYGCKDGANCRSIQFSAGYTDDFSLEKANEWNVKYRWLRASSDNGSTFKMDIDLTGGVTRTYVDAQFERWDSFVTDIKDFVAQ